MKSPLKIAFVSIFLLAAALQAQPPRRESRERIEAMKIGFITERLNLTPDEAKDFWPVYNKYQDELETLRRSRKENLRDAKEGFDSLSDTDLEKIVNGEIAFRQNELDVIKKYHPQFKKILPIRKVAMLYRTEEDFKKRLLEQIQERRDERRGR